MVWDFFVALVCFWIFRGFVRAVLRVLPGLQGPADEAPYNAS